MKKILLLLHFLFIFHTGKAQITLEHVFDSTNIGFNFYITDIGNNNAKYVFIDTALNTFSLFNLDATPFLLNIATPDPIIPDYSIAYITNTLFDCDSTNIEYAFMSYLNPNLPFRILRTDGTVLLHVDSAQGPVCYGCVAGTKEIVPIVNTKEGAKLFLFNYDVNSIRRAFVYGLCGNLPVTINNFDFSIANSFVKLFPNPSSLTINFEIIPPTNDNDLDIIIFDSNAHELKRVIVTATNTKFTLDVSNFSSGVYYYSLTSKTRNYSKGKFSVMK